MTTTPREVPVREAEWPHRPWCPNPAHAVYATPENYCTLDKEQWPCPSQQWVNGLVAAVRELPGHRAYEPFDGEIVPVDAIDRRSALAILEGARATDDEGQR